MGQAAAAAGAERLRSVLDENGDAAIIVATGASQFEILDSLREMDLDWPGITGFHLDEYIGMSIRHGASFRKYLWERFVSQVPLPMKAFHFLSGETDAQEECKRVGDLISQTSTTPHPNTTTPGSWSRILV